MNRSNAGLDAGASQAAVLEQIKDMAMEQLELPADRVGGLAGDTPLLAGLELDSLGQTILLAEIEERYGFAIEVSDRDRLVAVETVGDLIQFILDRATRYPS